MGDSSRTAQHQGCTKVAFFRVTHRGTRNRAANPKIAARRNAPERHDYGMVRASMNGDVTVMF